jgi:hypothetical protein
MLAEMKQWPVVTPWMATVAQATTVARLLDAFNREYRTPTPGPAVLATRLRRLLAGTEVIALLAGDPTLAVALVTLRPNVWYEGPVALLDRCLAASTSTNGQHENLLTSVGDQIFGTPQATISAYLTHAIRRFGDWVLGLSPPDVVPVTTLDLVPEALFPGDIIVAPAATALRRTRARVTSKRFLVTTRRSFSIRARKPNHLPCLVGRLFLVLEFRAD